MRVVDALEVIDVDHGQRERCSGLVRVAHHAAQRKLEAPAVAHPRERVNGRLDFHLGELLLQ